MPNPLLKKLLLAALLSGTGSAFAQHFTLNGHIAGMPETRVYLSYWKSVGTNQKDSVITKDGKFSFSGELKGSVMAFLGFYEGTSTSPKASTTVFLDPANISAEGNYNDIKHLKFSGGVSQTQLDDLAKQIAVNSAGKQALQDRYNLLYKQQADLKKINEFDPKLKALNDSLDAMREEIEGGSKKVIRRFMDANAQSYVSAFYLALNAGRWPVDEVKARFAKFPIEMQQYSTYLNVVKNDLANREGVSAGHPAKDFTAVDVNGKTINLADFKGKYVILDFWASWCIPCRAATPHLLELYNKYHNKGLEVIAIADDDGTQGAWRNAIANDKVPMWNHILRGLDTQKTNPDDLDIKYAVHAIPVKFLIDKNGMIAGRYDSESSGEMDKKLAEVFK